MAFTSDSVRASSTLHSPFCSQLFVLVPKDAGSLGQPVVLPPGAPMQM